MCTSWAYWGLGFCALGNNLFRQYNHGQSSSKTYITTCEVAREVKRGRNFQFESFIYFTLINSNWLTSYASIETCDERMNDNCGVSTQKQGTSCWTSITLSATERTDLKMDGKNDTKQDIGDGVSTNGKFSSNERNKSSWSSALGSPVVRTVNTIRCVSCANLRDRGSCQMIYVGALNGRFILQTNNTLKQTFRTGMNSGNGHGSCSHDATNSMLTDGNWHWNWRVGKFANQACARCAARPLCAAGDAADVITPDSFTWIPTYRISVSERFVTITQLLLLCKSQL